MRTIRQFCLCLVTCVSLVACQSAPRVAYETGDMQLQHAWPYQEMYWQQHATIVSAAGEQEFLLTSYFQAEESVVVAFSLSGQELFRIAWNQSEYTVGGADRLPDARLPWRMIGDMQLALWPITTLQESLRGLTLIEETQPSWQRLLIDRNGQRRLTIRADQSPLDADMISIEHEYYQITIRTLERELMESRDE